MESKPPDVGQAPRPEMMPKESLASVQVPRISIRFCTQCHWMLRAAYFAQELLSTFSTSLGEVALIPATGGVFTVDLTHHTLPSSQLHGEAEAAIEGEAGSYVRTTRLWDRKAQGGFPETKTLKKLVRDIIDPTRNLGHVDRPKPDSPATLTPSSSNSPAIDNPLLPSRPKPIISDRKSLEERHSSGGDAKNTLGESTSTQEEEEEEEEEEKKTEAPKDPSGSAAACEECS